MQQGAQAELLESYPPLTAEMIPMAPVYAAASPLGRHPRSLLDWDHLHAHVTSSARCRANSISRRSVYWLFFANTRRDHHPPAGRHHIETPGNSVSPPQP
jgi:hypothetical protein